MHHKELMHHKVWKKSIGDNYIIQFHDTSTQLKPWYNSQNKNSSALIRFICVVIVGDRDDNRVYAREYNYKKISWNSES